LQSRLTVQTMFLRGRDWWVSLDAAPSSHGGCQEKNSTRRARGRRGDSLQLGHDPGGMHGEVDGAVSGGRGRRHYCLGRTRGIGLGGREFGAAHVRRTRRQKVDGGRDFPSCSSLFSKERGGRAQAGGCPRGVPTRLDAKRRDLGETRSKYLPDGLGSRHLGAGFWRETREEFRRGSSACHARGSRPEKCSHGAAMPRFPLNSVSQLV